MSRGEKSGGPPPAGPGGDGPGAPPAGKRGGHWVSLGDLAGRKGRGNEAELRAADVAELRAAEEAETAEKKRVTERDAKIAYNKQMTAQVRAAREQTEKDKRNKQASENKAREEQGLPAPADGRGLLWSKLDRERESKYAETWEARDRTREGRAAEARAHAQRQVVQTGKKMCAAPLARMRGLLRDVRAGRGVH
jgi:hypothetical protein